MGMKKLNLGASEYRTLQRPMDFRKRVSGVRMGSGGCILLILKDQPQVRFPPPPPTICFIFNDLALLG